MNSNIQRTATLLAAVALMAACSPKPAQVKVPLVVGDSLKQANTSLTTSGLGVLRHDVASHNGYVKECQVIAADPGEGVYVNAGTKVQLTVFATGNTAC